MIYKQNFLAGDFPRAPKILTIISLVSLVIFLLVKLSTQFTFHAEVFYILIFLGSLFFQPWMIKKDTGVRLIFLGILLPLIFFLFNYFSNETLAVEYFAFEKLLKLTGFAAMGFWLGGNLSNIYLFLIFAFLGLVIALFNENIVSDFNRIFSGERVDFSIHNAQHTAMFFGLAIIGLLSFFNNLVMGRLSIGLKFLLSIIYIGALILAVIVFVGTQTRAALLALDILFVISVISLTIKFFKSGCSKKVLIIFIAYIFSSAIVLYHASSHTLSKRGDESLVTEELSKGMMDDIPMTSLGIRVNTWIEASKWIAQKPLHGWGGGVREHVIQQSGFSDYIKETFGHFHNSYVEFTLAYGVIGLGFVLFIFIWLNRRIYLLSKQNPKYIPIWYFTLYGSLFMGVINIFESFVFFGTGVYATAVLLAPAYSLHLSNLYKEYS